ncbi:LAGE3 protein, partial [Acromyrmex insinuator]
QNNVTETQFGQFVSLYNAMSDLKVELSVPFPSAREAEVVYQVLRVDEEPPRSEATKNLTLNNNILEVSFSGKEARKIRVALTSFFDNLLLVTETIEKFGPPELTYSHYGANN